MMEDHPTEKSCRMCIFIDNNQLFKVQQQQDVVCKDAQVRIDYEYLKCLLGSREREVDVRFYYSEFVANGEPEKHDFEKETKRNRIFQFLADELGFMMTRLRLQSKNPQSNFEPGVDCEIVYDMVSLAFQGHYSRFVLVSGSETFCRAVRRLRMEFGIPVDVAFFGSQKDCSARLKRSASVFIDLEDRSELFRRVPYKTGEPDLGS